MLAPAQLATLKAAIIATPAWNAIPNTDDGNFALKDLLNAPANPTFSVWRTEVKRAEVINAIDGSKYTPSTALDDAGLALQLTCTQRTTQVMQAQTKVMLLDILLREPTMTFAPPNVRAWLQDAVTKCPTGAAGANTHPGGSANGSAVLQIGVRNATEAERVLAAAQQGSDTTGSVTARVMGWEGALTANDVRDARNLP